MGNNATILSWVSFTRASEVINESRTYRLEELKYIESVARDFVFLLQEKWRIASDKTGNGNTKNIGSVKNIHELANGNGVFAPEGEQVSDDYWMSYLTPDMARAIDSKVRYRNLGEYKTL